MEAAFTIFHATNATDIFTMAVSPSSTALLLSGGSLWERSQTPVGVQDRRLQAGLEYTAKYNLGYDVPFTSNCPGVPGGLPPPKGAGWCFHNISAR